MFQIISIAINLILLSATANSLSSDTSSLTSIDSSQAQLLAADYDSPLVVVFIDDFANDFAKYSSYMIANSMEMPTSLLQYYYDIATDTDYSFTSDLSTLFPFQDFKTFITPFPWYTSLLSDVGASTVYAPSDLTNVQTYEAVSKFVATEEDQITYGTDDYDYGSTALFSDAEDAVSSSLQNLSSAAASSSPSSSVAITSSKQSSSTKASSSALSSETGSSSSSSASSSSSKAEGNGLSVSSILSSMAVFLYLLV